MRYLCNMVGLHFTKTSDPTKEVPGDPFDFSQGVKHDWSDMEISSEHEHVAATLSPEVRRSVRQVHRGLELQQIPLDAEAR